MKMIFGMRKNEIHIGKLYLAPLNTNITSNAP